MMRFTKSIAKTTSSDLRSQKSSNWNRKGRNVPKQCKEPHRQKKVTCSKNIYKMQEKEWIVSKREGIY